MKKYLLVITFLTLDKICIAQADCIPLDTFIDSLHQLNERRMNLGEDTGAVRQFYRDHYRQLRLYGSAGKTGGYSSTHLHFEIDMKHFTQVHQCLVEIAEKQGWFTKWHDPDENGFRRFSIYDTKKEKNSILFYDDIFRKANVQEKTGSFILALSLYW
jgi:hypothetical protein